MDVNSRNQDSSTVKSFGSEWSRFDQSDLDQAEHRKIFDEYFSIFPWHELPEAAVGADIGCGSGRWAVLVADRVGLLHCVDASAEAIEVSKKTLSAKKNVEFHCASVAELPVADASLDFCYSLGVLHHVPDTASAIASCAQKLKPGAPLLLYLYYALDGRAWWFRALWRMSDLLRAGISRLPEALKVLVTDTLALVVYWPLARSARVFERLGLSVSAWPLSYYRAHSFYTMRTDSRDRFGTPLERRFTLAQMREMMVAAGLEKVSHSPNAPYWCVLGYRKA
ncbi:class I SAM-dependent methyltransferase [Arenimonas oryziterrae]|uniref:Methyltransferase type 11 domain-containing protein n=1 Tax=Arenimonas oryziterrae DSM 21050 = YC6267 TaxID=1121015 RepID=A0A091B2H0_9GAMM|nr:class I SAM-dependent methyltransferase [Arenimonas oryziterrae]KFN45079.1 hypothetical protein N789_03390 [Arenimonas oryziterrae DSM 21050 = YC6267]